MEAGDPGAGGVSGDAEGQASTGGPGGQGGPGGPGGPGTGGSGEAGAVPREASQAAPALDAAVGGSDGDGEPAPAAGAPRPVLVQFTFVVLLRSTMEAEIAGHLLIPGAHTPPEAAHLDVRVSGSLLAIRLTAEDRDQLRTSITSFLQEFLLVIRTMRHILPASALVNSNRVNRG